MFYLDMHAMSMFGIEVSVTFIPSEFVVVVSAQMKVSLNVKAQTTAQNSFCPALCIRLHTK